MLLTLAALTRTLRRARRDPATFVAFCFADASGVPLKPGRVHRELQAFLSTHPKALVELPRDHGKTVQVCGRVVWELGTSPGLRVKLVCATDAVAGQRGRFLRDAVGRNPRVRLVFPHLTPAEPWAVEGFTVARPAEVVGPSVAAFGVGSGATGTRADLLVCDDIVDVRALHSPGDRRRAADFFANNLMNLLDPAGRFWGLSTPWHPDDVNARLKRNPAYALFRRPVGPDLEPVWPERWPREALVARRAEIGAAAFARGYHLEPIAEGEVMVRPEWVRFTPEVRPRADHDLVVVSVDPAVSGRAAADPTAVVVLGRRDGVVDCLAASARQVPAPALVAWVDEVDRVWTPDVVLFESNAAFLGIADLLKAHARFGPRVVAVTQSKSKAARVAALAVALEAGRVRLKGAGGVPDPAQAELFAELTTFPFAAHDDLVDALATGAAHVLNRPDPRVWV